MISALECSKGLFFCLLATRCLLTVTSCREKTSFPPLLCPGKWCCKWPMLEPVTCFNGFLHYGSICAVYSLGKVLIYAEETCPTCVEFLCRCRGSGKTEIWFCDMRSLCIQWFSLQRSSTHPMLLYAHTDTSIPWDKKPGFCWCVQTFPLSSSLKSLQAHRPDNHTVHSWTGQAKEAVAGGSENYLWRCDHQNDPTDILSGSLDIIIYFQVLSSSASWPGENILMGPALDEESKQQPWRLSFVSGS